ncbi:hypothetical protein M5689_020628 [Euphorbia peplus]|nr:hypothetical protein M5689_020628 [Euphorbia peplus]
MKTNQIPADSTDEETEQIPVDSTDEETDQIPDEPVRGKRYLCFVVVEAKPSIHQLITYSREPVQRGAKEERNLLRNSITYSRETFCLIISNFNFFNFGRIVDNEKPRQFNYLFV